MGAFLKDPKSGTWEKFARLNDPLKVGVGWNVREAQQQRKREQELQDQRLAQLRAQQEAETQAKKTAETTGQRFGWGMSLAPTQYRGGTGFNTSGGRSTLFGN